ncbi:macro domain-containing protein [Bacillus sp. II_CA]|uniref:macro domain-containing protein n=1 Tax=Bacillus sp. II_CA TaxID=3417451 RepID=UPI003CEE36DE
MKIKVRFFDKDLLKRFFALLSIISVLMSFALVAINIPNKYKLGTGIAIFLFLLGIYILMWVLANYSDSVKLNINNSTVHVKVGDIFEEGELKVIPFNEYFDTLVDNKIISDRSLNGLYINNHVDDVEELKHLISTNQKLKEKITNITQDRLDGNKEQYRLGTIFQHEEYLLTAFAKFDENNRAYLYMNDYINFLLNFWNEIDILYGGRAVTIPLIGSGITRFKEYNMITEQELLELLLWSFKVSKIKFTYPSKVTIVIHKSKKDKINFYKLRSVENGL